MSGIASKSRTAAANGKPTSAAERRSTEVAATTDEQIRNLDEAYRVYREERYRRFSDEFEAWRRNREAALKADADCARPVDNPVQESSVKDLIDAPRGPLDTSKSSQ